MATCSVLDLDDPNIRVELDLTREVARGLLLGDDACRKAPHPSPLGVAALEPRRSGTVEHHGSVEPVDGDIDRAGALVAAAHDHGGNAPPLAAAQIGLDPELALDAHLKRPPSGAL